jgi:hypothetical protein
LHGKMSHQALDLAGTHIRATLPLSLSSGRPRTVPSPRER